MCVVLSHVVLSMGDHLLCTDREPIQVWVLKHGEVKKLAPDHTARKGQSWDLNSGCLTRKFMHVTILL